MKILPMPTHAPVTGEPLHVTRLEAPNSGIIIEGRFQPNEFVLLPPEHLEFLRLFVKTRGNLKELERILGLSYPTIRLRFENLLLALGYEVTEERENERSDVLAKLERGEITAQEAATQLRSIKRR